MFFNRLNETIEIKRERDRLAAELEQSKANLDYVCMMTGVEIPVVESEVENHEQEI